MSQPVNIDNYIKDIIESVKNIKLEKIILFGSSIQGKFNPDSDLDLLIVLDKNEIPQSYDEKIKMKLMIKKQMRKINQKIAIDLILFTIPEYREFVKCGSSFSKEVLEKGKIIYEKAS